jgi:hypothetical protein
MFPDSAWLNDPESATERAFLAGNQERFEQGSQQTA